MLNEQNKKWLEKMALNTRVSQREILNMALDAYFRSAIENGLFKDEGYEAPTFKRGGRNANPSYALLKNLAIGATLKLPAREYGSIHVRTKRLGIKVKVMQAQGGFFLTRIA